MERNVYNCGETALFKKQAPSRSLVTRVRMGIKKYKNRITVLLACNMSGDDKILHFVIANSKNPRSFKNFSKDFFCRYRKNKTAWMTSLVFNSLFFDLNNRLKNEKRRAVLVLDNYLRHKITTETLHIEILYLPKNTTSKL
ncbi:Tigger transposable element-derived protein 6 [Nosema granulosis]|uniref:Tigger transposable element-derived protein 6 n=1 Tax=Nosema granulosis TaxID=83296 RepID=A0A9P6KXD7_9MICR|nr:Tigger transposable element-derived protein 6 [Nosema granulosis]